MADNTSAPSTTPRRGTRLTAAQRETQLLDVAEHLFSERGYEGVTVDNIARAAGVSRAIVYQHHGGKDAVFIACVRRARIQFETDLISRIRTPTTDWNTLIDAGGTVYLDLIARNPARWALLFTTSASLNGHLADELTALRHHTITSIANALRQNAPDASREALMAISYAISGIAEQLGRWWLLNRRVSRQRLLDYYSASVRGTIDAVLDMSCGGGPPILSS